MKIGIVTFVRAYNYGAVLQCYALSKALTDMGADAQVVDYYPEYFRSLYNLSWLGKLRILPNIHIRSWFKYWPVAVLLKRRNRGFEKFLERNIPLTQDQFGTLDELNEAKLNFDVFVSGSDQVWSNVCIPFDPAYYLTFPSAQDKKKCSYAASFGFAAIPDEMKDTYRQYLAGWDAYSVREKSGVQILDDLLGVKAVRCCDPTLLLNAEQWQAVTRNPKHGKSYILIYTVSASRELLSAAEELAETKSMQVIYLSSVMEPEFLRGNEARKHGFHSFGSASPDEWLGLFANANYVLTDSFHGTVFSLINHRKFMVVTSHKWGKNTRAKELLDVLDIHGRELAENVCKIDSEINWTDVDRKLETMREDSINYLKKILELGEA